MLGWKRIVWCIDRWDTSIRFCCRRRQEKKGKGREGTQSHKTLYFGYLWGGQPSANSHGIWRACCTSWRNQNVHFSNKIFRGFWSTGGQNFRVPIDFAGYRYNSAHCAACDNRNRLLLFSVGKHRYFCLFLVFLKTYAYVYTDIVITVHVHCESQCSTLLQNLCHLPCPRSAHHLHYCLQTDCLVLLTHETSQMSSVRFYSSIHTAMDLNLDFFVWCLHCPQMKH